MTQQEYQQARAQFEQLAPAAATGAQETGRPLALIYLDVDEFRSVNDTYGHVVGDQVLAHLSDILHQCVRGADTLVRWGGEEYVILAPQTSLDQAEALAEVIRQAVEAHAFPIAGRVTVSLGVTPYRPGDTPADVIARASRAAGEAKQAGRNRVCAAA